MIYHQPFVQSPASLRGSDPSEQALEQQSDNQISPRDDVFHEFHYTWYHIPHHHGYHPGMCHPWVEQQAIMAHPWEYAHFPAMVQPLEHEQHPDMVHPWEHDHDPFMILPFMDHPWDPHMDEHFHPYPSSEWDCYLVDYHHDWFHPWDHPHAHGHHPWDDHHW
ncbi:hypothetical protein BVG16_27935 [Paenibacillus selenitireducens]|uniref:Uncharacterized protein n=1 Tax=Paenibacillus selenitireducens TaxID=1324314 RepID=A0A1T2X1A0_9BACL|nr:hypothetical protein [Paenibacillus selenitireducens]OPA73637.1 hypothetical protein BVG16_27935 [Paenibacillus selenitireducens]